MIPNPWNSLRLGAVLACTSCALTAFAAEKIYMQENFTNYCDVAPGITQAESVSVGNDPIWRRAAELNINAPADKPGIRIYEKDIAVPALKAMDIFFSFRFMNAVDPVPEQPEVKNAKGVVTKAAVSGKPGTAKSFKIVLNGKDAVTISSDAVTAGSAKGDMTFIRNRKWEEATIRLQNGKLSVYISTDRKLNKILEVPFADAVNSVNFASIPDNRFSISDIMISDVRPLKSYPAAKHFADYRSLSQKLKNGVKTDVTLKPANGKCGFQVVLNEVRKPLEMTLVYDNGATTVHPIEAKNGTETLVIPMLGKNKGTRVELADMLIASGFGRLNVYVRPMLRRFRSSYDAEPQYIDVIREWDSLPPASKHVLDVDFAVQADNSIEVFMDGSCFTTVKTPEDANAAKEAVNAVRAAQRALSIAKRDNQKDAIASAEAALKAAKAAEAALPLAKLTEIRIKGNGVAEVAVKPACKNPDAAKYTIIDLSANPRAKAFADAVASVKPGFQTIDGIPFNVADGMNSADVAICKQAKGNWALEVEEYLGRAASDGFPSAIHYKLPSAPYATAHLILALDPAPGKDAVLTTRMAYYIVPNGSGGNMLSDHVITIKDGVIPDDFKQIGTVELKGKKVPLYRVSIPLPTGKILDIAAGGKGIDFEFIGKGWENYEQIDNTMKPHPHSDSAFNIFAVTLEKAAVSMDMKQYAPGNVFTSDEKAQTGVTLKALTDDAKGAVIWTARDVDGKEIFNGSKPYSLKKAGDQTEIVIPLKAGIGYYDLDISLVEGAKTQIVHPARFAILAKDNRKATRTGSPYATWWFSAHGSPGTPELGGPLMNKAGIRKCSWVFPTEEMMEKYNICNTGNLSCPSMRYFDAEKGVFKDQTVREKDPADPKKWITKTISGEENFVKMIKNGMKPHGFYDHILIWHESAPGYGIPEELLNMPITDKIKEQIKADERFAKYINESGRLIRKHFPNLRIQIGNSSASVGAATRPLRAGADPQYYDSIGIETPSQVIVPEKMQEVGFQGLVISRDIAKLLAKKDVPINGSWEFVYRCERDMGEQQQAEWYMRDVLLSLANNFTLISPGIFFDCCTGYYNGLWGQSGILLRAPYVYPKRAYVAYAALTQVLDNVKFVRQIATGSTTVYALEFKRGDGNTVTALWSTRGNVEFELKNPSGKAVITDLYGREKSADGDVIKVNAGTAPAYVTTAKPLTAVAITGRSFPKEQARADQAKVAVVLDDAAKVIAEPDPQHTSTHTNFLPILKPGTFTVSTVQDAEKGASLEVKLDLAKDPWKSNYIMEYTTIRLKEPAAVPGNPAAVGIWVKGNSSWGQIRFEIEDANGEVFKNLSTGKTWGCDILDWPGNLSINFDGWCFIGTALRDTKLFNDHSPGPVSEQWVSCGGDKKIDLPIKIRAVSVGIYRHKLDLLDFKASDPAILLREICGIEE